MTNTEFRKRSIRHGEVMLIPIDSLPKTATETFNGKECIVGHSETGHFHTAVGDLKVFTLGNQIYLQMFADGTLKHKKSFDFHAPKTIFKGIYKVTIKKAYDYFAKRMANVRD